MMQAMTVKYSSQYDTDVIFHHTFKGIKFYGNK
jgi:hypothetical protein